ncbi:MAG TPA: ATP-binding cassette domain-containing protein [Candidatus Parcubacteria bacterium]|jgi:cell division transport system ATP-binding protein|nr:cell division ATP-binding protein FtsE [Parcubacteria group bacterium]HJN62381.1 ATP-binding cassette domain-containing protein [Candidatus Parcubacteria bacterium]|tara:strand:- start:17624 stop:18313 length:690 start_codon:yes stop_codon:yes gene_type:complete
MISFKDISKIYNSESGKITALEKVSFEVKKGEFLSVVGRSGAGKTTLFKLLLAKENPTKGHIVFRDQDVHKINSGDLSWLRRKIASVFQDYKLFPLKTLQENIAYVMEVTGAGDSKISSDVAEVLDLVGLSDRVYNFPAELSGGEKQRAAIARALVQRPEVMLADEPTGNLDPYHTQDIIRLLLKVNEMGTTVILATHDKELIDRLGKRVITLKEGRIVRDEDKGRFIL